MIISRVYGELYTVFSMVLIDGMHTGKSVQPKYRSTLLRWMVTIPFSMRPRKPSVPSN